MINLPKWALTNGRPAHYDSESATAIEMVAKIYGAMQSLIDEYNVEIDNLNEEFQNYENDVNQSNECFKEKMITLMNDFMESVNMLNDKHTKEINEAINYMKNELDASVEAVVQEMIEDGQLNETIINSLGDFETELNDVSDQVETINQDVTELKNKPHLNITYNESNESFTIE